MTTTPTDRPPKRAREEEEEESAAAVGDGGRTAAEEMARAITAMSSRATHTEGQMLIFRADRMDDVEEDLGIARMKVGTKDGWVVFCNGEVESPGFFFTDVDQALQSLLNMCIHYTPAHEFADNLNMKTWRMRWNSTWLIAGVVNPWKLNCSEAHFNDICAMVKDVLLNPPIPIDMYGRRYGTAPLIQVVPQSKRVRPITNLLYWQENGCHHIEDAPTAAA